MKILVTVLVLVVIIGLYITTYILNKRTPAPIDIEKSECSACNQKSCGMHPTHNSDSEIAEE